MYMPILKWKRGEQVALSHLVASDKASILPLVELVEIPDWVLPVDALGRGPFDALAQQIAWCWGTNAPIAIDMEDVDLDGSGTPHPIDVLFATARAQGLHLIPVTGPSRSFDQQDAVARAIATDGHGVVVRLTADDFFDASIAANTSTLLARLGTPSSQAELLCDLGYIGGQSVAMIASAVRTSLTAASGSQSWRSTTLAASNFPQDLSTFRGVGTIPRNEWMLWQMLQQGAHALRFGDYAIAHAIFTSTSFVGAANIRYTDISDWLILRGFKLNKPQGHQQFVTMSKQLVQLPNFRGATFSWGDDQIAKIAGTPGAGTGNLTTWRSIGTNHHIVVVLRALAALGAISSPGSRAGVGSAPAEP